MTLPRLVERAARPTLVLVDVGTGARVDDVDLAPVSQPPDPDVTYAVVGEETFGDDRRWGCVVLAVADVPTLRRIGALPPHVGRARSVVMWLDAADAPVVPDVRPEWPDLAEVDAHRTRAGGR